MRQSAVVGAIVRSGVDTIPKVEGWANRDAILSVVDPSSIGENVDVGTLGTEFAVSL